MGLDAAEAMIIGELRQAVAGIKDAVADLVLSVNELRETVGEERRLLDARVTALEAKDVASVARKEGVREGFSIGQKIGFWSVVAAAVWGVKSGLGDFAKAFAKLFP